MRPAFSDVRLASGFTALLLLLLTAPLIFGRLGVLDRAEVYTTFPAAVGPMTHIQREVFMDREPLDIAFIGSSFMWSGVDAPQVQRELTRALGRQASVTTLAGVWPGLDRDYAYLHDLLANREVRLVVLQLPNRDVPTEDRLAHVNRVSDEPHVQAFRFFRAGELEGATDGLPSRYRGAIYAGQVLGLPRHLLTLLRPNLMPPASFEATLGTRYDERGYFGRPYEPLRPDPPTFTAEELTYSDATNTSFRFFGEPLPPYQMHFARRIAALLEEAGVPAVLLHIPQANEITSDFVEERMNWLDETAIRGTMIGVAPSRLFHGFTREGALRFFSSDHLNDNGTVYFTSAVMPALLRAFEDHAASH